jgi:hypothetical protein
MEVPCLYVWKIMRKMVVDPRNRIGAYIRPEHWYVPSSGRIESELMNKDDAVRAISTALIHASMQLA